MHHVRDDEIVEDGELLSLLLVGAFDPVRRWPHSKVPAHLFVEGQVLADRFSVFALRDVEDALVEAKLLQQLSLLEDHAALLHQHLASVELLRSQVVRVLLQADLVRAQFDLLGGFGRLFGLE